MQFPQGVQGERKPEKLADLQDLRVRANREEVAKSLEGRWQEGLPFVLKQEVALYDTFQGRTDECDQAFRIRLKSFQD